MSSNTSFYREIQVRKLTLKDIFSDVLKKHSSRDFSRVFIAGTSLTTPRESEMLNEWQKPFVFAYFFGLSAIFMLLSYLLSGSHILGGFLLMFAVATVVPITLLILVWEMNIPRNIPLYEILVIVLIGGVISLIATMAFEKFNAIESAISAAFTEEPAKLLVIFLVLKRKNYRFTLNGVLVGMAVGTGFSVFENLHYTLSEVLSTYSMGAGLFQAYVRAVTDIAGHGLYAALYGGALVMAKGSRPVSFRDLGNPTFLSYFAVSVGIHMLNNSGLIPGGLYLHAIVTSVICLAFFLPLLRTGVNEVVLYVMSLNDNAYNPNLYRGSHYVSSADRQLSAGCGIHIEFVSGPYSGSKFIIPDSRPCTIGRLEGRCDLPLPACPKVSGSHCSVQIANGVITVMDLNSKNGTFVASQRLAPMSPCQVHSGAIVYLGGSDCAFQVRIK